MQIVLATDIFGQTRHVEVLVSHLRDRGHTPEIISPFTLSESFSDEEKAYAFFLRVGGGEAYAEKIRASLQVEPAAPLICLGFSAGAAALWKALAGVEGGCVIRAILFYGAQIRNAVELQPRCETLLVFPAEEPHFSVPGLINQLQGVPGVACCQVAWQHGYMNRLSRNFDGEGYRRTLAWLDELLDRQPGQGGAGRGIFGQLFGKGSAP